ncbi:hypothetical protein [Paracidovorax cattleyae]|uniref:hypothetical protein n=1 Tax=Paracidovorax cattleyae TaxID=80868 RepID=UPI000AA8EFAD|nr:hypothetical protein [Paracidovorax cattleyae]
MRGSLKGIAIGGFILGVTVSTGIEIIDFVFNSEKTMYDLVGGIGVEAVKGGLGGLVAYAFGLYAGSLTAIAVAPLIVMALAAFGAGVILNYADEKYQIKNKVVAALKNLPTNISEGLYKIDEKSESWLDGLRRGVKNTERKTNQEMINWLCPICRR